MNERCQINEEGKKKERLKNKHDKRKEKRERMTKENR